MKKYLILFISIFTSFFLIDKVKAVNGTSLTISPDFEATEGYDITKYHTSYTTDFYSVGHVNNSYTGNLMLWLSKTDRTIFAFSPYLSPTQLTVIKINTGFEYNNISFISSGYMSGAIILSRYDLPTLGGNCSGVSDGSFCYVWKNSGLQGNYRSASMNSDTIFINSYNINGVGSSLFFNSGETVSSGSSYKYLYSYNESFVNFSSQDLKNNSNYSMPRLTIFELEDANPEYNYEIMEGTEKGKRLLFEFTNFIENSSITVVDMSSGNILKQEDLQMSNTFDIDNISYDSIFYFEIYNNDELVDSGTINVYSDFLATGQPIININLDKNNLVATLGYYEIEEDYLLYYAINDDNFINLNDNPENLEIVHLDNDRLVHFPNTGVRENNNYVLRGRITDSNGRILYDIGYNVIFFPDKPYFSFESSYNPTSGANEITITLHNFENSDIVYYSYDNINFTQFDNININKLVVYSDTDIYTKVVRGNNTYYGFYHVNLNEYNNSSNSIYDNTNGYDDNLFTGFKNLFTGVDMSFLSNISTFFNALKGSYVFRFVMLCITGALILFIMRMIRR